MTSIAPPPAPDPSAELSEVYAVSSASSLQERRYRTLKSGDTFGVFDHGGDIIFEPGSIDGLFFQDTRHLSQLDLTLGGLRPLLLSSTLGADSLMLTSDLSNASGSGMPDSLGDQGVIHVQRSLFLGDGACHLRLAVRNFAFAHHRVRLDLRFAADFADLFEVRGMSRAKRGTNLPAVPTAGGITLGYRGLDGLDRATTLSFTPAPAALHASGSGPGQAVFQLELQPRSRETIFLTISCRPGEAPEDPRAAFLAAYVAAKRSLRARTARTAALRSSHEAVQQTLQRSASDLRMLVTEKPTGPYPYAGIPWFSTPFGRDGLITALLTLMLDPELARGVLCYLAQEQATAFDPDSEAEPGKILHEVRGGEMAALREVPFRRYYGSVDSTPLFVMLAGAYLDRTGDLATVRALWPNIAAAIGWVDRRIGAGGFLTYQRSSADGLANQGWKDSHDAISHADGTLARGAIALCEVQGYAYAAYRAAAAISWQMGDPDAPALDEKADRLRVAFEAAFWVERLGTYALALDGEGRQCQVRSSNAGQVLMTGIAAPDRARRVVSGLMEPQSFTGWGIRTLAANEARYNPMSYHNGSVWPHDNALIALGMARVGMRQEAVRLLEAMCAAAGAMELHRLPELFCGFGRRPGQGPTSYPVACAPQAWATACVPGLLQACLGIWFDPAAPAVLFNRPALPAFLDRLHLDNLPLGGSRVSVLVRRTHDELAVSVAGRSGERDISVVTTT